MSDGATNIRVNGNEYADIFPVWEWDRIPGTTLPAGENAIPLTGEAKEPAHSQGECPMGNTV